MIAGRRLALYALPALPFALPTIPVAVLLPAHYAEHAGLGPGATAMALTAARALDVLSDPLVGWFSDRGGRFGRRKPWIAAGALLAGVALVRLFDPPAGAGALHLFTWSALLYLGWTMVQVPYQAWGAELESGYHARTRVAGAREAAGVLGLLAAGAVPAAAAWMGHDRAAGLAALALVTVVLGAPAVAGLLMGVPEPAGSAVPPEPPRRALAALARNRAFLRLLAAWTLNGLATGVPAVLFPFFVGHALGAGPGWEGAFLLLYFACAVAAVPLWLRLARAMEKHRAWCAAMTGACAAFATVPLLGPGDVLPFALVCVVTGAALGADLALPPAMQADVVDVGTLTDSRARAGVYFAAWTMATKLALAVSVAVALPLAGAFGFDPLAAVQPPGALTALAVIYAGLPIVAKAGAVALVRGYALTARRHAAVRRRIESRAARAGRCSTP
ncbi:MFS transporter [Azospirillum halopraeferens]|uniref:MFS transporter n=1 Tax=Azospirillum halopraeferens TaxID=34010 RepID=UPI0004080794|nr:MFS transporter [Azospirillum halopraeferens]